SKTDAEKFRALSGALQAAFNPGVFSAVKSPAGVSSNDGATLETDPRFTQYLAVRAQITSIANRLQLGGETMQVELTGEGIVIHLEDAVLFAPGQADLRPGATRVLDAIADVIGPLPNQVRVEGHTDNVPPADPRYPDNWQLSALRAVNTVRYLTDVRGVAAQRLAAVGYGQYRPRADNDTIEGRRRNRRVDFVILQPSILGSGMPATGPGGVTAGQGSDR
ncbi:MAG: OmpA family protein, partial [Thermomicrobiaceae bacterium]|nr:OmpA family protein [Thermomicrobiaceae bacterium]